MRSASAAQFTSLFGSVALHACVMLVLVLAARRRPSAIAEPPARTDPWLGASAVEVDAVATPEATPNIANAASAQESESEPAAEQDEPAPQTANEATARSDAKPTADAKPASEHPPEASPLPTARPKPRPPLPRPRKPAAPSAGIAAAATPAENGQHHEKSEHHKHLHVPSPPRRFGCRISEGARG